MEHKLAVRWLTVAVVRRLDLQRLVAQIQLPPYLPGTASVPEPDLSVVAVDEHGRSGWEPALLVVEVSASSLRIDRTLKTGIYAESERRRRLGQSTGR